MNPPFSLDDLSYEYPVDPVPGGFMPQEHLVALSWKGAQARYPGGIPHKVQDLLNHELRLIEELRFAPYFLTLEIIIVLFRIYNLMLMFMQYN